MICENALMWGTVTSESFLSQEEVYFIAMVALDFYGIRKRLTAGGAVFLQQFEQCFRVTREVANDGDGFPRGAFF